MYFIGTKLFYVRLCSKSSEMYNKIKCMLIAFCFCEELYEYYAQKDGKKVIKDRTLEILLRFGKNNSKNPIFLGEKCFY